MAGKLMSGLCSAHKHHQHGCPQCEAFSHDDRIKRMMENDIAVKCFICGAGHLISQEDYDIADVKNNPIACWKHGVEDDESR